MTRYAIKGNQYSGEKIIKALESIGGINSYHCSGNHPSFYYYVSETSSFICKIKHPETKNLIPITLSEFQELCKKSPSDKVNHPSHYTWLKEKCGLEVIDITRHLDFDKGNAIKYLLRAGYKTEEGYSNKQKEIEDLDKAIWYINDKIKQLKNE